MATSRLLKISTTLPNKILPKNSAVSSLMLSRPVKLMCMNRVELGCGGDTAVKAAPAACVLVPEKGLDFGLVLAYVVDKLSHWRKFFTKPRPWRFNVQMFVEKVILDCRFFTLLAITGSLLGSLRCFVEGCFLIAVTYAQYLQYPVSEQGNVVMKLIEAIDMFLMGTAMLVFAISLHVMFLGPSNLTNLKKVGSWMQVECAMEAKSKMGHALIMILQMQVLDKCKSIAVSSGMDLAYFAATIFLSTASIFLLSRTKSLDKQ